MFSSSSSPINKDSCPLSINICIYYTISLGLEHLYLQTVISISINIFTYLFATVIISQVITLITTIYSDMLRTSCFFFLFIGFVTLSWPCLCDSRRFGPMEKKFDVNRGRLLVKNNKEITKLEAPSTNETKTLSSQAPIKHVVVNHDQLNEKSMKDGHKAKRASLLDKTASSKRVSRTLKVPKSTKKKQPRSDEEHPAFSLDYMQPTTHPPHHN